MAQRLTANNTKLISALLPLMTLLNYNKTVLSPLHCIMLVITIVLAINSDCLLYYVIIREAEQYGENLREKGEVRC